ncbi:recombinase family protein [Priestia megaterium]|uniref:recombinase family protein n=1 Tax=Priestia megaterium TaxID=1404 RepID=UPI000CA0BDD4|nr:recombinase family protein [Priestia megaterium]AUO14819.1 recombinase family protein [Priestia megaterium]
MIGIYVRVSTQEQGIKGYSIDQQIDACIKKAGTDEVMQYIDIGYSGEFLERPDLERLRKDVREGLIDKVICYDPDRLARKLMSQLIIDEELRRKGVEVEFVNGEYAASPEGRLFFSLRGAISEFEKAKIKERMMSGRKGKAKKGKVVKNDHVFGYDFDKENSEMIINEREAEIVKFIFDAFTDPMTKFRGMNGIAKHLTETGVPTKKGGSVWHRQVVRQILMNETYTGFKIQNRWDTEGMLANKYNRSKEDKIKMKERPKEEWLYSPCPVIIEKEQFDRAQDLMKQARRRYTKNSGSQYLLSGLLRCAACGNTLTGVRRNNWGTTVLHYTDVKNTAGAKNRGCGIYIKCEEVDKHVWDQIQTFLNNPEVLLSYQETAATVESFEEKELKRLEEEIEKTKKGRKRLLTLISLSEDDLDLQEIKDQIISLQSKEKNLREQYTNLQTELEAEKKKETNTEVLKQAIELYFNLKEEEFTFDQKQKLIRMITKEIRVLDKETVEIITF